MLLIALAGTSSATLADAAPRARVTVPSTLKPTDLVELADGKQVPAKQVEEELNQLQEAIENSGFSLRRSDKRPFRGKLRTVGQEREAAEDKAAFGERVSKLRARRANGFRELVRARGALKPSAGAAQPKGPKPADEPLSLTYEEALGKKDKASIFVAFGQSNSADADKVGCEGGVEAGAYLFNSKLSLVKAVLKGAVEGESASGRLELYLIGKMVDSFPKSGSNNVPEVHKALNPPEVSFAYPFTPITIKIAAGVAGEMGVAFTNTQTKASGNTKGSCTAGVVPYVRGTGRASASVQAAVFRAGVEVGLTLVDMRLPATATISLLRSPLSFKEDFDASIDSKFLDGQLDLFVQTNIPRKGEKAWDIDWDTIYRKTLFGWEGFPVKESLAHFEAKQTPLQ